MGDSPKPRDWVNSGNGFHHIPDNEAADAAEQEECSIVRLRGLPWACTEKDIHEFFDPCKIKPHGIVFGRNRDGRMTGEGMVDFDTVADCAAGLEKHNQCIGSRYIEVFQSTQAEYEAFIRRNTRAMEPPQQPRDYNHRVNEPHFILRLRGLPFSVCEEEIQEFFRGLPLARNDITICTKYDGRSTGEGFVKFYSELDKNSALQRHRECIGSRYIEVFECSYHDFMRATEDQYRGRSTVRGKFSHRSHPYERQDSFSASSRKGYSNGRTEGSAYGTDRGGYSDRNYPRDSTNFYQQTIPGSTSSYSQSSHFCVKMRGLPYKSLEHDIAEFFAPIATDRITLKMDKSGRSSGEALVHFFNEEDLLLAMRKNGQSLGSRYIELFREKNSSIENHSSHPSSSSYNGYPYQNSSYLSNPHGYSEHQPLPERSNVDPIEGRFSHVPSLPYAPIQFPPTNIATRILEDHLDAPASTNARYRY